jgi:hypothetical protein
VRYTENSIILLKLIKKQIGTRQAWWGKKMKGSGPSRLKNNMATCVVTLEHGTYLCLVLQLDPLLVSESRQNYESSYSFVSYKECHDYHRTIFGHVLLSQ